MSKKSSTTNTRPASLGIMIKLIKEEYGHNLSDADLALFVEKEFDVVCTAADIKEFNTIPNFDEDYEKESRQHKYFLKTGDIRRFNAEM